MLCFDAYKSLAVCGLLQIALILLAHGEQLQNVAASTLQAFEDFMEMKHLKHAIIVASLKEIKIDELQNLASKYCIRFFNVATADGKNAKNFTDFFYAFSPRVGIYVPQLENVRVRSEVLIPSAASDFFNNSQAWLMLAEHYDWSYIRNTLQPLQVNVNADITLALKQHNNSLSLYDIYKYCHACGLPLQIETKGTWTPRAGFSLHSKFLESFVRRRRNFGNIALKATTVLLDKPQNYAIMEYLADTKDQQRDGFQRKTYQLLKMMEPLLNMSLEVNSMNQWGVLSSDGNWSGVMGQVVRHEVEVSICPMRILSDRVHFIQYGPVVHIEYIFFLFRHPRRNAIRNIFFQPFAEVVWWSIVAIIALSIFLLAVHLRHEYRQLRRQQQRQRQHRSRQHAANERKQQLHATDSRFDYVVLLILEAVFMQGPSPDAFRCSSTRLLVITTCLFSVMLLQFYSAFIVGSLLAVTPRTITTLAALYNSSLEVGMEDVPYQHDIFMRVTNPIAAAIFAQRICQNRRQHILPLQQGVERLGRGGFAFHVSIDRAYRMLKSMLTDAEFCDLQQIKMNPPTLTSTAIHKNSPFTKYLSSSILLFKETGLMQYNDKLWQVSKPDCSLNPNQEVQVDLEHFVPALVFLGVAMLCSLLVLLLECLVSRLQHKRRVARGNP